MKFSELDEQQWEELAPFLDTCILPISGLNGSESPDVTIGKLSSLQKLIDEIEKDFRGRVVVFPAFHYSNEGFETHLNNVIRTIKNNHFKKVVCISADLTSEKLGNLDADFVYSSKHVSIAELEIKKSLPQLWE